MPDIHWGYGFCIGGVVRHRPGRGRRHLPRRRRVRHQLRRPPRQDEPLPGRREAPHARAGEGAVLHHPDRGREDRASTSSTPPRRGALMGEGPSFVIGRGLGVPRDLEHTEANGRIDDADPDKVSDHAVKRGAEQCGTLGSGNHFLEVQVVDSVFDADVAKVVRSGVEPGLRDDPLRQPRPGLSGVRRRARGVPQLPGEVRHRAARPTARVRPGRLARRAASTSTRCGPPPTTASATGNCSCSRPARCSPSVFGRSWEDLGMDTALRRGSQHREARGAHGRGEEEEGVGPPQGRDAGVPGRAPGGAGAVPRRSASRSSSPATWAGRRGCWSGQPGSMEQTFGTTCHGAGRAMSRTAAVKDAARPQDRQGTGSTAA